MADVRPFKGLRYGTGMAADLPWLICPPFDTIPIGLQKLLYQQSPYNVVRLEAGDRQPPDSPQNNRYTRAAATFKDWMDNDILVRERDPAFYLVQHTFTLKGKETARLELMGCVRLEDYQRRVVLPHEYTRDEDKSDRLALMEACNANFSPIMCLYRDEEKGLSAVFQRTMAEPALADFSDAGGQSYRMWKIDSPDRVRRINEVLSTRPLYIADGHHRYETALTYRDLMSTRHGGTTTGDEASNHVMMGLIEFNDPGLAVLPYHRVLGGLDDVTLTQVKEGLEELFDARPFHLEGQSGLEAFLEDIERQGRERLVLGLLEPMDRGGCQLLNIRHGTNLDAWGPIGHSEAWILEQQVLKPILGDSLARCLDYVHDANEAEKKVKSGESQMGFFLKPFPLDLFETIMNLGHRLPPKSTFFYPKLATGLVINLMDGKV